MLVERWYIVYDMAGEGGGSNRRLGPYEKDTVEERAEYMRKRPGVYNVRTIVEKAEK